MDLEPPRPFPMVAWRGTAVARSRPSGAAFKPASTRAHTIPPGASPNRCVPLQTGLWSTGPARGVQIKWCGVQCARQQTNQVLRRATYLSFVAVDECVRWIIKPAADGRGHRAARTQKGRRGRCQRDWCRCVLGSWKTLMNFWARVRNSCWVGRGHSRVHCVCARSGQRVGVLGAECGDASRTKRATRAPQKWVGSGADHRKHPRLGMWSSRQVANPSLAPRLPP